MSHNRQATEMTGRIRQQGGVEKEGNAPRATDLEYRDQNPPQAASIVWYCQEVPTNINSLMTILDSQNNPTRRWSPLHA